MTLILCNIILTSLKIKNLQSSLIACNIYNLVMQKILGRPDFVKHCT